MQCMTPQILRAESDSFQPNPTALECPMRPAVNALAVAAVSYACEWKTLGSFLVILAACWAIGAGLGQAVARLGDAVGRNVTND